MIRSGRPGAVEVRKNRNLLVHEGRCDSLENRRILKDKA